MNAADREMLDLFVQESAENLEALEGDLIALEANPADSERLNSIFRSVHSIKGAAGFFGFDPIVKLAHVMESVMSYLRDGVLQADESMVSLLISTSDKLRLMLAEPSAAASIPCASETAGLQAILDVQSNPGAKTPKPDTTASAKESSSEASSTSTGLDPVLEIFDFEPDALVPGLKHGQNFYVIRMGLEQEIEAQGQSLEHFFNELASLGTIIDASTKLPAGATLATCGEVDVDCRVFFTTALEPFLLSGALGLNEENLHQIPKDTLAAWVKSPTPRQVSSAVQPATVAAPESQALVASSKPVATIPAPENKTTTIDPKPVSSPRRKAEETIRINVGLLDSLMNLAGEMVLGRNRLLRLSGRSSADFDNTELHSVVQEISSVTSSLQDTIMRARLQPVGGLFSKFTRIVRDLSHKLKKEIQLEILGDDVELDRTLLEGLSDPLTHLVRNSVDHGIEPPADRIAKGKASCGLVRLSAAHLAGRVQIEVTDDGGGMDPERLKAKAIEKGIVSPDDAARMSDADALQLIFAAGFSTAAAVSDISGRGVGMDVVKTNIEKLGGHVEVQSKLGEGSRIVIRLPLTLAIVPALIVGCRGMSYALPQINIEEIVLPSEENPLKVLGGARVLELRGQLLPVVDLAELLGMPHRNKEEGTLSFVVVLRLDHMAYGLVVDQIQSNEEIVVKPLGRHLRTVPFYSGATLLGQGEIAMILDPAAMANGRIHANQGALNASKTSGIEATSSDAERVLLFNDGEGEQFAIHLANVMRVENINLADVERIGNIDCLRKNHDSTLRLLRLSDLLPVTPSPAGGQERFLVVPRPPYDGLGIVATRIVDSADLATTQIDTITFKSRGIMGSAVLLEKLSIVLDLPEIVGMLSEQDISTNFVAKGQFVLTANPSQSQNPTTIQLKQLPEKPEHSLSELLPQ